ncbi:LCM-domain-containing protein [Annulohypoxylon maeteangense]|uniref:LCM-domain-containing protein n=1 Tax=Annulohypoxylon maeteangense TaxID=1927788 RepID=UPI002007E74D|nr:LCM-domain-containing protein [Annulohypoxylon maeteangense]KAI0884806.1 LCM-domain-containing protein [Annulohypoxylon maeteangense]
MPHNTVKKAQKGPSRSAKQQALDDLVMATNSSSIVSKRSVERIYYPDEPHFFRFFVKKFQRRAPLINRGYYIRLHVIDVAVRRFLERPSEKKKVVINLGCGSDVLPWQCMTRYPNHCQNVKFVDIDFPDLIEKKCRVVQETPELNSLLTGLKTNVGNHVQLQSDQYIEIGCDLRRISDIEQALSAVVNISDCEFMFVAEVSITYMETDGADSVIQWASTLGQAEFCLLEQIIPDGEDHPFAQTMLAHFEKLKTPLKSVFTYPTLDSQRDRFASRGWSQVDVNSLWHIWCSNQWLPADERRKIDAIELEPFDEWEEFALFAGHYCVVIAKANPASIPIIPNNSKNMEGLQIPVAPLSADFNEYSSTRGQRRFGAGMRLKNNLGEEFLANTFGSGTNTRLRSFDLYERESPLQDITTHHTGPSSRMCHTVTDLGDYRSLLVGGRTSPSSPLRDCWLFDKRVNTWQRTDDLPSPIYRHSITRIGNSNMALLIGGKSGSSTIFDGCLLYSPSSGWIECEIIGSNYVPIFGGLLASLHETIRSTTNDGVQFTGVLAGGISQDGIIAKQILRWVLVLPETGKPAISFIPLSDMENPGPWNRDVNGINHPDSLINRFGATGFVSPEGHLSMIGGIIADGIVTRDIDVINIDISGSHYKILSTYRLEASPRPLLIGVSTELTDDNQLVVMGGGATCFSMGTFWNRGSYTLHHSHASIARNGRIWKHSKIVELTDETKRQDVPSTLHNGQVAVRVDIPRVQISTAAAFLAVMKAGKPTVIEGGNLGSCVQNWSSEYIVKQLGSDRKVVVHEANSAKMDFNSKNFAYVTKSFGNTMQEIEKGHKLYLRALSEDHPTDQPANIKADFPQLAGDFQLPDALTFVKENEFSSVLRITGPVNMWLHYDVMANVYCQVAGFKRFILFPPSDVTRLSFAPGSSSSSVDIFSQLESPSLAGTHPHEAVLKPGDILFLPPLWLHTASPLSNLGVAVNVFFRNLENGYSSGRDVYGNRDLAAYEKGRLDISKVANGFNKLPFDMRDFYIKRLADELAQKAID